MATVEQWNAFYNAWNKKHLGKAKSLLLTSRRHQIKLNRDWTKHCEENGINALFEFLMKK